jgi:hypothetical protein
MPLCPRAVTSEPSRLARPPPKTTATTTATTTVKTIAKTTLGTRDAVRVFAMLNATMEAERHRARGPIVLPPELARQRKVLFGRPLTLAFDERCVVSERQRRFEMMNTVLRRHPHMATGKGKK